VYTRDEQKFEDILVQLKLITPEQVDMVKIESARSGKDFEDALGDMKIVSPEDIVKASAISRDLAYVDLTKYRVNDAVLNYIPRDLADKYQTVPFSVTGGKINLGMIDPNNLQAIEYIEKKSGMTAVPYMASQESIKNVLAQYQDMSEEVSQDLSGAGLDFSSTSIQNETTDDKNVNLIQDAPITRAVNTILDYAARAHASDIHIEPRAKTVKVRYRIDGVLHDEMSLPQHIHPALVSRIKILSNLKIDEHRVPQDGRFDLTTDGRDIDLRVSISPTIYGEKIVIRLLDKSGGLITLEDLGIYGKAYKIIEAGINRPHGMVLSTGPTGSGKSTTLYAILNKMNKPEVNIVTLEDPVEYQVDGVNQIQINPAVGLTFASGLRSILRQDPNIIMVGEIRDDETANLAVQSALTGHTVLSTLHTNNASGVLPRLLDMQIEPFLIASTVSTVIGQRLVRRVCPSCKESYEAPAELATAVKKTISKYLPSKQHPDPKLAEAVGYKGLPYIEDTKITLYRGKGCDNCMHTGFQGRIGIFEVFTMSAAMEKLLQAHATTLDIQNQAVAEGMITMREDGFLKALVGITSIEEVIDKAAED
jgi:type IV pilus assembly protein PilB